MPDDKPLPDVFLPMATEILVETDDDDEIADDFEATRQHILALEAKARLRLELGETSAAEDVISANLAAQTREILGTLTPREEKVLRMRFGIGEQTEEVGHVAAAEADFEVTKQRIREIEAKALRGVRGAKPGDDHDE